MGWGWLSWAAVDRTRAGRVKAGRMCGAQGYDIIESDKYGRTLLVGCKVPGRSSLSSTK